MTRIARIDADKTKNWMYFLYPRNPR